MLRFMDDFYLFSDKEHVLTADLLVAQHLLGDKGLSLNPTKTEYGPDLSVGIGAEIDDIKIKLRRRRRELAEPSGADEDSWDEDEDDADGDDDGTESDSDDDEENATLAAEETEYLLDLLKNPDIDESDAELVLVLLRDHGEDVLSEMHGFLEKFPSLSRNIYNFARFVVDRSELANLLHKFLITANIVTEDQLFWIAKIAEDYLSATTKYGGIFLLPFWIIRRQQQFR